MRLALFSADDSEIATTLFADVFTASEGEAEGEVIKELVANLLTTTQPQDLFGFTASDNDNLIGCIFLTRFSVPNGQQAFLLSPVAVATKHQGLGVGQQLIRYGLEHLKRRGVELVFTYGDPAFYAKTGFEQVGEDVVKAPFTLSYPDGWLAQSLDGHAIHTMHGVTQCVEALRDSKYW